MEKSGEWRKVGGTKKGKRVESREERGERNEKGRERERDGSVFADPLSAASAPDPAFPSPVARHGFASTSGSIRPWMVWGRAAGGARQIRELHCQAGMIYLTNISI